MLQFFLYLNSLTANLGRLKKYKKIFVKFFKITIDFFSFSNHVILFTLIGLTTGAPMCLKKTLNFARSLPIKHTHTHTKSEPDRYQAHTFKFFSIYFTQPCSHNHIKWTKPKKFQIFVTYSQTR
jgi:hypothetical protein